MKKSKSFQSYALAKLSSHHTVSRCSTLVVSDIVLDRVKVANERTIKDITRHEHGCRDNTEERIEELEAERHIIKRSYVKGRVIFVADILLWRKWKGMLLYEGRESAGF